ncbi:MAG: hypothetical protein J1F05_07895 [Muribaculaceae bacterium]|nr:hypothetical protein [Muribaculaceae bacterium]
MKSKRNPNLIEVLSKASIVELRKFANDLNIEFSLKINKKELSRTLATSILGCPQNLLDILFTYELKVIKQLINNKIYHNSSSFNQIFFPPIVIVESIDPKIGRGNIMKEYLRLPEDLIEALHPLIDDEISKRKSKSFEDAEIFLLGLTTLKGCINEQDIINQLRKEPFGKVTQASYSRLFREISKRLNRLYLPQSNVYLSPYVDSEHMIQLPGLEQKNEPIFRNSEIRAASKLLDLKLEVYYSTRLYELLEKERFTKREIDELFFNIWSKRQQNVDLNLFDFLSTERVINDKSLFLYSIATYYNFLPMWKYRGRTAFSEEGVNPPVLWDISSYKFEGKGKDKGKDKGYDLNEYIEFLHSSIVHFYDDSIYWDKKENLFLYIDNKYLWSVWVGTDDAKDLLDYYIRIPFPSIMRYHRQYKQLLASRRLIKKFVLENFEKDKLQSEAMKIRVEKF